jgi:UDP-3-O-[3-hydroxymyristoyl] glucosamine N-acyltransferase
MDKSGTEKVRLTAAELTGRLGGRLCGPGTQEIRGVNTIRDAGPEELCFLTEEKHRPQLASSRAAAVLVQKEQPDCLPAQVVVPHVQKALIEALKIFAPKLTAFEGVHPSAVVEADAILEEGVAVGPGAYIGHQVQIGAFTVIGPNCSIGQRTRIGSRCRLDSNVVVYHDCQIGNFCILQSHCTIGATGFGYAFIDGKHELIPHNGGVILEDGVEIGANTCVDRAKFGNTIIGAGTKIDNLVQIAHNVRIGRMCLLAGQVGIAGSAVLGDGVVMAGDSGASDHVTIGDGAIVAVGAIALQDIGPGRQVWGLPAQDMQAEKRSVLLYQRLPEMARQLKELSKKVQQIEAAKDHQE